MNPANALGYPFRRGAGPAWLAGVPLLLLFPLTFVLVFGYAVRATRSSLRSPAAPPPSFSLDAELLRDGALTLLLVLGISLPFALATWLLASALAWTHGLPTAHDAFFDRAYALLGVGLVVALPWGLVMLLVVPPNLAAYAAGGGLRDLFDPLRAVARVRGRFLDWNLASAAIVTGWALGLAAVGLMCVGSLAGAFYAILVSAHASASLAPPPSSI